MHQYNPCKITQKKQLSPTVCGDLACQPLQQLEFLKTTHEKALSNQCPSLVQPRLFHKAQFMFF